MFKFIIAICDNNVEFCSQLELCIEELLAERNIENEIEIFYSGKSLYNYLLGDNYFDLIFLDVNLRGMDGIQTGKLIRSCPLSGDTQIAYMSVNDSCAMELFQNRPIDFMLKPIQENQVLRILDLAYKFFGRHRNHLFSYSINNVCNTMPVNKILYFESDNRKVNMIINNTEYSQISFYDRLENVHARLDPFNFICIHKSYLVNFSHVKQFEYSRVFLDNKIFLPISQHRRKAVRNIVSGFTKEYKLSQVDCL